MGEILDGKAVAAALKERICKEVESLFALRRILPGLAVVRVGDDPASQVYFARKEEACRQVGMNFFPHLLPAGSSEEEVAELLSVLNASAHVHGIMLELPLPKPLSEQRLLSQIAPHKDVDGVSPLNLGKLLLGEHALQPCTPRGVMELLAYYRISLEGKRAVVVGRSNIVGKPLALLLLQAGATVTVCHSRTADLAQYTREADILCVAVGRPGYITGEMIKKGAVVIDIGINSLDGKITGDVDFASAVAKASAITPVPGGIGALTTVMALQNTLEAAKA